MFLQYQWPRLLEYSCGGLILTLVPLLFYSVRENTIINRSQSTSAEGPRSSGSQDAQNNNVEGSCSCLSSRMDGPIAQNDLQLLKLTREKFLLPPSTEPYHLTLEDKHAMEYNSYRDFNLSWRFLDEVIQVLFKDEPPGFFVEAGAFDGEFCSNTLDLERLRGWKGLLVEADEDLFSRLRRKNRKVWISNTCLATAPYPHRTTLVKFANHKKPKDEFALSVRGFNALIESTDLKERMEHGFPVYQLSQCLPLATLLLAVNVSHVDLISLDVEGVEMEILRTFFSSTVHLTVDVWIVEHKNPLATLGTDKVDPDFIHCIKHNTFTNKYKFKSRDQNVQAC
ncbi:uncharacterized protein [Palaemon carinicauda]|uniref:uncharacterized protein n=1 Tax=Palaemon carinicauda TaxID=392227 RepID=UPI0035B62247